MIEPSHKAGVHRLLFLGPVLHLSEGGSAANARVAPLEMCWSYDRQDSTHYLAVMPTNLYGPGDSFDLHTSHVLPALIRNTAEAKLRNDPELVIWGTGRRSRELMHSTDLAAACVFLMNLAEPRFNSLLRQDEPPLINFSTVDEIKIRDLAELVAKVLGYQGRLRFDETTPDEAPQNRLNSDRLHDLRWHRQIELEKEIQETCQSYFIEGRILKNEFNPHLC